MADREEVIRGLECCAKKVCIYKDTEKECPYWELSGEYEGAFEDCTTALAKDAIAFVKAQEPNPMPGAELTDAELMEKVRKAPITLKPAADAIPVEWLEAHKTEYLEDWGVVPVAVEQALTMWLKEQEAR